MKVLGFTDERTVCDCGKQGLKGVYVVETHQGDTLHLGSSCVQNRWNFSKKEFTSKIQERKRELQEQKIAYLRPYSNDFKKVCKKYPNVSKYTPDEEGYKEFMIVFKAEKEARKVAENKYKFS